MIESQLLALGIDGKWLEPLNAVMDKYEINTKKNISIQYLLDIVSCFKF